MGNRAGSHQKRPFTVQTWQAGKWNSGGGHFAHLDNAIESAKYGGVQRVVRYRREVMYRNAAALRLAEQE